MFVPHGYLEVRRAAALMPDCNDDGSSDDPKGERLGRALASGDLVSHGVVVGATWDGDVEDLGAIRELRPEAWRMPGAREAISGQHATRRLVPRSDLLERRRPLMDAWGEHCGRPPAEVVALADRPQRAGSR
jgi:hypothetical protein